MCEKNPDFCVGRYETRAEQPLDEGAWPSWETGGSWRGAGGYRAAPYLRGPRSRVTPAFWGKRGAASFVRRKRLQPHSACPTTRPLEPLRLTEEEAGKWPDQSGQSRFCRTASEFAEVGEAVERRSPNKENVAVTTSCLPLPWKRLHIGGDSDARHLPISASSVDRRSKTAETVACFCFSQYTPDP